MDAAGSATDGRRLGRTVSSRLPSCLVLLGFLLVLAAPALAADEPLDLAIERKRVREHLRAGDLPALEAWIERIAEADDAARALQLLCHAVPGLALDVESAVAARDAQGHDLQEHFLKHATFVDGVMGWTSRDHREDDKARKRVSARLNRRVQEALALQEQLGDEVRELLRWVDWSSDPAGELIHQLQRALKGRAEPAGQRALLAVLDGELVERLRPELGTLAGGRGLRGVRVAALRALLRVPSAADGEVVVAALSDRDPAVRRAAVRLAGAVGTREALGALVEALRRETGQAAFEIAVQLSRLGGEQHGLSFERWADWWRGLPEEWRPRLSEEPVAWEQEPPRWRYFGLQLLSARVVFVLDVSGSMLDPADPEGTTRLAVAREQLERALRGLPETASFSIVAYSRDVELFAARPVPASPRQVDQAIAWLEDLPVAGHTNIADGLLAAWAMTGEHRRETEIADTIVLLSDGTANCGTIPADEDLLAEMARLNAEGLVSISTVCLGDFADETFLEALAGAHGGQFVRHGPSAGR